MLVRGRHQEQVVVSGTAMLVSWIAARKVSLLRVGGHVDYATRFVSKSLCSSSIRLIFPSDGSPVLRCSSREDEIAPGDSDGRATMKAFFGGDVTHLPLRDPLTLE